MVTTVNTHDAKTLLSQLLRRVEEGEEIVIARDGKPIARLVPERPTRGPVRLGTARGQVKFAADWDAPMTPEELAEWYDGPVFPPDEE